MKYAILGDIHGNLEAMEAVLAACRELGVDKYACIGDVVGYNANPKECLDLLRGLGDNLVGVVKGNHDEYVSNGKETLGFNPLAATAVEWTRRKLGPSPQGREKEKTTQKNDSHLRNRSREDGR